MIFPNCHPFTEEERPRSLPESKAARRFEMSSAERFTGWATNEAQPFDEAKARRMLPWLWVDPPAVDGQEAA